MLGSVKKVNGLIKRVPELAAKVGTSGPTAGAGAAGITGVSIEGAADAAAKLGGTPGALVGRTVKTGLKGALGVKNRAQKLRAHMDDLRSPDGFSKREKSEYARADYAKRADEFAMDEED